MNNSQEEKTINKEFQKIHTQAKALVQTLHQTQSKLISILQKIDHHKIFLQFGYPCILAYAMEELQGIGELILGGSVFGPFFPIFRP